jgi:hypothetical protein
MASDIKNKLKNVEIVGLYKKQCQSKNLLFPVLLSTIIHENGQLLPRAVLP